MPELTTPPVAARVMDLADPRVKMGQTGSGTAGTVYLLDPPDVVRRKVARAVTDSDTGSDAVRADREAKPGVTNLLAVLTACAGPDAATGLTTYGALKRAVTDAVLETLEPIQRRYADLSAELSDAPSADSPADGSTVARTYAAGTARCRELAAPVLAAAHAAMGLTPRPMN